MKIYSFFILLAFTLLFTSCGDLDKPKHLKAIAQMDKSLDSMYIVLKENRLDTLAGIQIAANSLLTRIKTYYVTDTIDMELGKKMNVDFKENNEETARELQKQLEHLMSKGAKGHQHIGQWLHNNLVSDKGMPWIKATGYGKDLKKIHAVAKHGSESPLSDILKNKNTKFTVTFCYIFLPKLYSVCV